MTLVLAIESSCDETAASVVDGRRVLSSVIASQIPVHARWGGVVPELASRAHLTAMRPTVQAALQRADRSLEEIEALAVTAGPGLAGCLLVGLETAKALAWSRGVPLVAVDHVQAHVDAIFLEDDEGAGAEPPSGPYVALAVSGGHTSVMRVERRGDVMTLGQTLDDAAGECFDKVAKLAGLPYPGGVHIDRLSEDGDPSAVVLPRPMLRRGLDFSFSGLKTAARYHIERAGGVDALGPGGLEDLCASVQEAIVDVLVHKAAQACVQTGLDDLVIAGGVACNRRLRERARGSCQELGLRAHITPARYCTDNAAMVGGLGGALLERGEGLEGGALLRADLHLTRRPAGRSARGAR